VKKTQATVIQNEVKDLKQSENKILRRAQKDKAAILN
jgi:23S rRNA maturation mini-RNase III